MTQQGRLFISPSIVPNAFETTMTLSIENHYRLQDKHTKPFSIQIVVSILGLRQKTFSTSGI